MFEQIEDVSAQLRIGIQAVQPGRVPGKPLEKMLKRLEAALQLGLGERCRQVRSTLLQRAHDVAARAAGSFHRRGAGIDHPVVNLAYLFQVKPGLVQQPVSRAAARGHSPAQQFESVRLRRQGVGLAIVDNLQAVLQLAKKLIGGRQASVLSAGEMAFILQSSERQHGPAMTYPGIGAAVEALQALH